MNQKQSKNSFLQLIKFGIVGVSNTFIDLIVTMVLNAAFGIYYVAKIIGYACGIINSYAWNSRWTFKEDRKSDAKEIVSFLVVNLLTLGISLVMRWILRDKLFVDAWWMNTVGANWFTSIINGERFCLIIASGIALIINFIDNKLFVFNKNNK